MRAIPVDYNWPEHDNWAGDRSTVGFEKMERGDTEYLSAAQAIMDKLMISDIFSYEAPILTPSVVGYIPNVPAAISGHPEAMYNRGFIESPSIIAPLNIYVETTLSAGLSQSELTARGVATAAFALAMETIRPVSLYALTIASHQYNPGTYGAIVKIASKPMDLGRATWMLASPTYSRRFRNLCINWQAERFRSGSGPWAFNSSPGEAGYDNHMRKLLDMAPDDVFIKGGYLFDSLMITDPVTWVKAMVEKQTRVNVDSE